MQYGKPCIKVSAGSAACQLIIVVAHNWNDIHEKLYAL
jgi:hypothetical protein